VFCDDDGRGAALARELAGRGHTVTLVRHGSRFARDSADYTLDPSDQAGHEALCQALATHLPGTRIVHTWGFESLLHLGRALGRVERPVQVAVVTAGAWPVTGTEHLHPEQATVAGPALVLPQEYPHLTCRQIDCNDPDQGATALAAELLGANAPPLVALRGRFRWVPVFRPVTLPEPQAGSAPLQEHGVWLITGGLGGVGLALAGYLARTTRARLVLTGRRPWPRPDDAAGRIAAALRDLEAAGAEVLVAAADVTDRAAMEAVVARARDRFGRICGVIHAAGVVQPQPVARKTADVAARVMAAKVGGARVLDAVFADDPPDAMVLCSSLAGVFGGIGLVDYAAANAFLDAFAARRALERPGLTVSIGWDGWHGLGMAAALSETEQWRRAGALSGRGITAAEGGQVLHRILGAGLPQVLVSVSDLDARIARDRAVRAAAEAAWSEGSVTGGSAAVDGANGAVTGGSATGGSAIGGSTAGGSTAGGSATEGSATAGSATRGSATGAAVAAAEPAPPAHPRPALATAYAAPRNPIEEMLSATAAEVLGIERVGIFDNFFDLGMDSFLIIQVHGRLRRKLSLLANGSGRLTVADMFEYHNVSELARRLGPRDDAAPRGDGLAERARRQQQAMEEDRRQRDRRAMRDA
jgi:NAD(P)-dependent dehydrogenase (short-subunit alcohol dehydrogenase family)